MFFLLISHKQLCPEVFMRNLLNIFLSCSVISDRFIVICCPYLFEKFENDQSGDEKGDYNLNDLCCRGVEAQPGQTTEPSSWSRRRSRGGPRLHLVRT